MTPKELVRIRSGMQTRKEAARDEWEGSAVDDLESLLDHIDAQAAQIAEQQKDRIKLGHQYLDLQYVCDSQDGQIKLLREKLVEERARVLYFAHAGDDMYDMDVLRESDELKNRHVPEARQQLKVEMPEVEWE